MLSKMSASETNVSLKNFEICILGPEKAGKSSIISRYVNNNFEEKYLPTLEDKL